MVPFKLRVFGITTVIVIAMTLGTAAQEHADPRFAAVSIKPFQTGEMPLVRGKNVVADPAGLHVFNESLNQMVCYAYGINNFQLAGGPAWARGGPGDNYNLDATTSAPATDEQLRVMLQSALAERFGLVLDRQVKPTPVLALVVAKGGPVLRGLDPGEDPQFASIQPGSFTLRFATTKDLVGFLNRLGVSRILGRPLVDNTGLTGRYDIHLTFAKAPSADGGGRSWVYQLPKLLKPFGLELKPTTSAAPIYTIRSVHRPVPN